MTCMSVSSDPLPNAHGPELYSQANVLPRHPRHASVHAGRLPLSLLAMSRQPDVAQSVNVCAIRMHSRAYPSLPPPPVSQTRRRPLNPAKNVLVDDSAKPLALKPHLSVAYVATDPQSAPFRAQLNTHGARRVASADHNEGKGHLITRAA